ncbi:MAG: cytochrome c [Verrucomicrobiae bacterium]|nr:cytochrome c [Verrucomicrobiae bacterium]NNJ41817.1 cytochrome c [Akkermansiaceae bacterium]
MKYKPTLFLAASALFFSACDDSKSTSEESGAKDATETASQKAPEKAPAPVKHPLPGDPVAGEAVYKKICTACHQADGSGMNGMLAANFVKDKTRLAKSNEELLKSIRDGITKDGKVMPPQKGVLTEQEMKDALAFIRKSFGAQ